MGLYNFQQRFVKPILRGEKTHTIRAIRKYPAKPGDTLYLYTGLRTKYARKLLETKCVKVECIEIAETKGPVRLRFYHVAIDGIGLGADECEQLARRDGFSSFHEMMKFWTTPKNRLPFSGHVIHWK